MSAANLTTALVQSICSTLANKAKYCALYARKNKKLGEALGPTLDLLFEQLLPTFCHQNLSNPDALNTMHNLIYLLAQKCQNVFTSHVIHTAIDQNWDMKGLKQVLVKILKSLEVNSYDALITLLDAQIKNQNLQSSSCIKAINSFVRNPKKTINQDDLANSISTYETDFDFIQEDIAKYRFQRIKYECFSVLHPWAYDLEQVDFKYILNNNINDKVISSLSTLSARVFWLSHFKCQTSVSADDFFQALRESWEISKCASAYEEHLPAYLQSAARHDYVYSISNNAQEICDLISQVTSDNAKFDTTTTQVKTYDGHFEGAPQIKQLPAGFSQTAQPNFGLFSGDKFLGKMKFFQLTHEHKNQKSTMQRRPFECLPNTAATHKLNLQFEAVDTEEIKGLGITFEGGQGIFKIGEGDANHYQIPNDKKLWESQLMIVCKDGKYYVRDLGIVHTSRIKIDKNTEVQIQQDMLVDLGKVVHYHFNKVTHSQKPSITASQNFQVLFNQSEYTVEDADTQEPPAIRARPTWVSSDESKDNIQKEILLEAYSQHQFSIGRSAKREVQIKLKAVSADHCVVNYDGAKGWSISEKGKDKLSSNGTFVFMKSFNQMNEHEPSDLILLHDGMVLSFINYEIRVNLEKKDGDTFNRENAQIAEAKEQLEAQAHKFQTTVKAESRPNVEEVVNQVEEKEEKLSAENFESRFESKTMPVAEVYAEAHPESAEEVRAEPVAELAAEAHAELVEEVRSEPVAEHVVEHIEEDYHEPVVEVHSEPVAEHVVEHIEEAHHEPVAEVHHESVAEVHAEPAAEAHAEPAAEAHPEHVAEVHAEHVAEANPELVADVHPESVAEAHPEPVSETNAEHVAEAHPEHVAEAHPEHVAEAHPEHVAEAHPDSVAEAHPEHVVEAHPQHVAEAHPDSVAEAHPEHVAEAHPKHVAEANDQPVAESHPGSVAEPATEVHEIKAEKQDAVSESKATHSEETKAEAAEHKDSPVKESKDDSLAKGDEAEHAE